ncbi:MAG: hypothetical protein MJK18_07235, partial [Bdellovibrionales bacterium]|nr:hypothetical protein [Bdellovibrionales bacterium]
YEAMVPFDEFDEAFKAGGISDWDLIINESSQLNFKDRGVFHQLHLIKTPVLFMAGEIQDQDATDALHAFESRKDNWTQSSLKCPTKLAVGPWLHGAQTKLSREMASQFAEDALSSSVHCETPHQVEYIKNMEDIEAPQLLGDSFEDLFSTYSSQISISSVDYGFLFEDKFTEDNNSIELPLTCRPYEHISPGLSRPIAILDIEKDLVVHGPIEARFTVSSPDERFIGLSMDILIGKKDKGWSSFDDRYNMNRVRKRVYLQEDQITRLELTSPYHHFELEEGDQLIFSLQRSTKSADWCNGSFDWIMDDENNFEASFHYSEI